MPYAIRQTATDADHNISFSPSQMPHLTMQRQPEKRSVRMLLSTCKVHERYLESRRGY